MTTQFQRFYQSTRNAATALGAFAVMTFGACSKGGSDDVKPTNPPTNPPTNEISYVDEMNWSDNGTGKIRLFSFLYEGKSLGSYELKDGATNTFELIGKDGKPVFTADDYIGGSTNMKKLAMQNGDTLVHKRDGSIVKKYVTKYVDVNSGYNFSSDASEKSDAAITRMESYRKSDMPLMKLTSLQ